MKNILIGVFRDVNIHMDKLKEFEQKGWDIHLFDVSIEHKERDIESILLFLEDYYKKEVRPFFVSDIDELISYVRDQIYDKLSGIIWCVEKENRVLHNNNDKNIYLLTSDVKNVLYQITHSHYCYLYFNLDEPYQVDTYISVYCHKLAKKYQCDTNIIVGILLIDELFLIEKSYDRVNRVGLSIINEPTDDLFELIESVLPHYINEIQVSLLMAMYEKTKKTEYLRRLCEVGKKLEIKQAHGLMWTLKRMTFVGEVIFNDEDEKIFRDFYEYIVDAVKVDDFKVKNNEPKKKRIVVLTNQFLGIVHAPTRTVIDYAANLMELGYEVMIINTADFIKKNFLPLWNSIQGNYASYYDNVDIIEHKGMKIPFFQNRYDTPNNMIINMILRFIDDYNPEFVINVGDSHVTADVCAKFFKTVQIPCSGGVPLQKYGYLAVPSKPNPDKTKNLNNICFNTRCSFLPKVKSHTYTRAEFGLPDDAFLITIVGNRLAEEINDKFIVMMEKVVKKYPKVYFVFLGTYAGYDDVIQKHAFLKTNSKNLGFQEDIMAIHAMCNAYLNPKRKGGGSSAADAMLAGLPVITPTYGDVYYQLWLDESYDTDDEVLGYIGKMMTDEKFYAKEREKAVAQIQDSFNTKKMMLQVLEFMESQK